MWKTGCVIAVALLCGCTDAVYMRNASGETGKWPPRCLVWVATASRGADLVFLGSAESRFSAPA